MTDLWSEEQYRRTLMEERLTEAASFRLLPAARGGAGNGINLENLKRLACGPQLDKTIVLGGLRVRITAG